MWELAEKRKDGSTVCAHERKVEYSDGAMRHTDDHSECKGTGNDG